MKEFKDSKGRPWQLAVNCDTIEGIKEACGVNVLDLLDPDSDLAKEVLLFPPLMAKLLFAAVAEQAVVQEVDDREFRRSMGGDSLSDGGQALLEELISFCPRHRREVAAAVLAKNRDVQEAATELALAKLADPALKDQVLAALESNLRREMEAALVRLDPEHKPEAQASGEVSATESSTAAGTPQDSSDSPVQDLTPGGS